MKNDSWQDALAALRATMADENESQAAEVLAQKDDLEQVHHQRLDIIYERKGRAGKSATIISGFTMADDDVEALASDLKRTLGTGGSARGGEILIQGDRRDDVLRLLTEKGYKARVI